MDTQISDRNPIIGTDLLERYTVSAQFNSEGSFGTLFSLSQDSMPTNLLAKISEDIVAGENELYTLMNLKGNDDFPDTVGGGNFRMKGKEYHFIIMKKLGKTLYDYFTTTFSISTVCQFGIKMLYSLEKLHAIGRVHNDLKPQNILVGDANGCALDKITLIDFGLSTPFYDYQGMHIAQAQNPTGKGNQGFSSFQCLNGNNTCRRDDLISLLYIMLYLDSGEFRFLDLDLETATNEEIVLAKYNATAQSMCKGNL